MTPIPLIAELRRLFPENLSDTFPEINPNNYNHDDVLMLNAYACRIAEEKPHLTKLLTLTESLWEGWNAWEARAEWADSIALGSGEAPPSSSEAKVTALRMMDELDAARAKIQAALAALEKTR